MQRKKASRKQALMAGYGSLPSPKEVYGKPGLFSGFSSKGIMDTESLLSPTSILDCKPFSALRNPFWSHSNSKAIKNETRARWEILDSGGVGLGIVDALRDDKSPDDPSKPDSRMVLFGSKLKIQIPPPLPPPSVFHSQSESPPGDFGIKTRNAQLGGNTPTTTAAKKSDSRSPPGFLLSASDMELSEDYTRVISHGPNPKTTHIFDDCIVESCCGIVGFSAARKESDDGNLGHDNDIYMNMNEKAFCNCESQKKEEDDDDNK